MTVIGIDIGGSKSHGVRVSSGVVERESFASGANISSVGLREAGQQIKLLAGALGRTGVEAICVGAAGVDTPSTKKKLRGLLELHFPLIPVQIVHDTRLVLAAAGLAEGVVLISGTGSAAWGRTTDGTQVRAGGWGYALGDDGGGFGLIRAAIRHVLDRADQGLPMDLLTTALLRTSNVDTPADLLDRFYERPAPQVWASRTGVVFDLAAFGDESALRMVQAAATELARTATRVAHRLEFKGPVVLAGGVARHRPMLQRLVRTALAEDGLEDMRVLDRDPVHGAVALAEAQVRLMAAGQSKSSASEGLLKESS